jgi:hypothetical protein
MLSIRGIYTGKEIKPLEYVRAQPNVRVIITFLDDEVDKPKMAQKADKRENYAPKNPTQAFLDKCGGWEDTRSPEEIITEIYASRTTSDRGTQLLTTDTIPLTEGIAYVGVDF